jgi:sugar O-acyltransferase (sialic acid O-acetyltransferase NeuD family)
MTKKIAIFGAGGFGREVAMLIEQINSSENTWEIIGFYDDGVQIATELYGYKVLGGIEELNKEDKELCVIFAIGDPKIKKKVINRIDNSKITFPVLIHPNALLGSKDVNFGEGCIVTAGNIITVNVNVGKHVILNLACTIGHDTIIGDYCSFMPAVNISGEVEIKEGVYVGTGAKIINQLEIGANTVVGAGAVVSKTLPANCTAVGIPAKPIKFHE